MKTLLFFLALITYNRHTEPKIAYICDSSDAKRYHYRTSCRGLSNCSYRILKTTEQLAKKSGRTLCQWEK